MQRRFVHTLVLAAGVTSALVTARPASAQVVHAVSFGVGIFTPKSVDNRVKGDVWVADLNQPVIAGTLPASTGSLDFSVKGFRSSPLSAEWHLQFGEHVEVALGGGYANQTVKSAYRDLVDGHGTMTTADDTDILQDLRLQTVPLTGVVRLLSGRPGRFQLYAGGGIVASIFKYTESGEFVDTTDFTVFPAKYEASGTAFGPMILAGTRSPLGGDVYALNFELRYQWLAGKTGGYDAGFLGEKLDLGGWSFGASFMIRY